MNKQNNQLATKQDINVLKNDIGNLKYDMGNLKNDMGNLKEDMGNLKQDMGLFKQEMKESFAESLVEIKKIVKSAVDETDESINRLARQMVTKFDEVDQNFIEVRADIAEIKKSLNETNKKLDITKSNHERRLDIVEDRTVTLKNHMENGFKKKLVW